MGYCVLRERPVRSRLEVAATTGLTPLVGREQEMSLLCERWEQAKSGMGQILLLSGEPGIGKSRLMHDLIFVSWLGYYRREPHVTQEWAEKAIAISLEQGFPHWVQYGGMFRGWALGYLGQAEQGVMDIRHHLDGQVAAGTRAGRTLFLSLLAEAHEKAGQIEEGLRAIDEAISFAEATDELGHNTGNWYRKGELLLAQDGAHLRAPCTEHSRRESRGRDVEAEACFLKAIAMARRQSAKSWELRTTTGLARLWQKQGKKAEAHQVLSEIYGWFTEGFDTKDLQEAKALLGELNIL